jgi:choline kinase
VRGVVLAAGAGRRLAPLTDDLPKTLLAVDGERTILDVILANLSEAGLSEVTIVTGVAAHRIEERRAALERAYGISLETIFNPRAEDWNNAYSLWLARDAFAEGAIVVNGDTVHPASVEQRLLEAAGSDILLAVDREKTLGEEEMKVVLSPQGTVARITKFTEPAGADGEYIGVTYIAPGTGAALAEALQATFERDPSLYYEDGYQEYADRGNAVRVADVGAIRWIEIDNHDDLARARELLCRS